MTSKFYFELVKQGIILSAVIGPVSLEMVKRGLAGGFWPSFSLRLGGAIGNTLCLFLTYFGLVKFLDNPTFTFYLTIVSVAILVYLAYNAIFKTVDGANKSLGDSNSLFLGFNLAVFNPVAFALWPSIISANLKYADTVNFAFFASHILVIVGVLLYGAVLSLTVSILKTRFNVKYLGLVSKISGACLLFFAYTTLSKLFV